MSTTDPFVDYNISAEEREKLNEVGLETPSDVAFAFTNLDEAKAHGVGGAWVAMRRFARAMTSVASASWRSSQEGSMGSATRSADPCSLYPVEGGTAGQLAVLHLLATPAQQARMQHTLKPALRRKRAARPEHDLADRVSAASAWLAVAC